MELSTYDVLQRINETRVQQTNIAIRVGCSLNIHLHTGLKRSRMGRHAK
jgi:hypothetical protein